MNSAQPLTTSIPSPTLSLNFADIAASKRASTATSPAPTVSSHNPALRPLGPPTMATRTLRDVALEVRDKVSGFLEGETADETLAGVKTRIKASMEVIEQALVRYGPDHLAISYNGGKDCLVLLILILACLPAWETSTPSINSSSDPLTKSSSAASVPSSLQALYVISTNPFPEVQGFVANTAHEYRLDLASFSDGMRAALSDYLAERPKVRAVFVGTRRTDPHSADLAHFTPTDEGWPACMRVHPIIDWHYVEIWAFIRALEVPFCKLYDLGYTSLGGMSDTRPNPALAVPGSSTEFKPAYELTADDQERLGRDQTPSGLAPIATANPTSEPGRQQHSTAPAAKTGTTLGEW